MKLVFVDASGGPHKVHFIPPKKQTKTKVEAIIQCVINTGLKRKQDSYTGNSDDNNNNKKNKSPKKYNRKKNKKDKDAKYTWPDSDEEEEEEGEKTEKGKDEVPKKERKEIDDIKFLYLSRQLD